MAREVNMSGEAIRVLLVDDHAMVRQGLRSYLSTYYRDIEVVGDAGSGEEALQAVHTLSPSVVVMDINMPVMDGYEAAQRIRAYESKHQMTPAKIIAVTALQSEAAQTEAFGSGFDMFLSKPIKLKSLAKLIQDG